jgi:hypothetical protein
MSHDPYVLAAMAALVLLALYRRFRRLFGRQLLRPARMRVRVGILSVVGLALAARALHSPALAMAGLAGLAAGASFGYVGLRLTRLDVMPAGVFYTPNGYLGAIVSALLLGRLVYRFQILYPGVEAARAASGNPFAGMQGSPLTTALFGVVIGYYIAYYAGLLLRAGPLRAPAAEPGGSAASPPSGP